MAIVAEYAVGLPALTQRFFDRDYSEEDLAWILGLNFIRVFREIIAITPFSMSGRR